MTVGDVVNNLPHSPAPVAIGGVELRIVQAADGVLQALGQQTKRFKMCSACVGLVGRRSYEASDGVAKIVQFGHGTKVTMLSL